MPSGGIKMQAGGNALFPAGLFHQPAVGAGYAVVQRVDEEHGRRLRRHLPFRGTQLRQIRAGGRPQNPAAGAPVGGFGVHGDDGVDEQGEIRPGGNAFQRVFRFFRQGAVPKRGSHGSQMAACGKAHDADAVRVNPQRGGMPARYAQSLPGVQQRAGKPADGIIAPGNAVLHDNAHHAVLRRPAGDMAAFLFNGLDGIAPARKNAQGRAPVLRLPSGGKVELHLRFPHVRNMSGGYLFFLQVRRLEPQGNPPGMKGSVFRGRLEGLQHGRFKRRGSGVAVREGQEKGGKEEGKLHAHGLLASEMTSWERPCTTSANWG